MTPSVIFIQQLREYRPRLTLSKGDVAFPKPQRAVRSSKQLMRSV